ncbi:hypothetical protein EVG20_g3502 [Dentipellis fragilis]|uniref:BHLH domain-containing protein n=1 Tax=Dentipellis fragilis TaxID=205917 RepID=A0A4Y9Z3Y0_9AGAM|nr:hypothetical protein EVG20_g3502 [Dentipellis fragilis]
MIVLDISVTTSHKGVYPKELDVRVPSATYIRYARARTQPSALYEILCMAYDRIPTPTFPLRPTSQYWDHPSDDEADDHEDNDSSPTTRPATPAYQSAPTIRSGRASSSVRYQPYPLPHRSVRRYPILSPSGSNSVNGGGSGSLSGAEASEDELHSEHGDAGASRQSSAPVEAAAASDQPPDKPAASPARVKRSSPSKKLNRKPTPEEIRKSKADAARTHRSRLNVAVESIRTVLPQKHLNVAKSRMIPTIEQARIYILELQQEVRQLKASRAEPS